MSKECKICGSNLPFDDSEFCLSCKLNGKVEEYKAEKKKMRKPYEVRKFYYCEIIDQQCGGTYDYNESDEPNCKDCTEYKKWIEEKCEVE